MSDQLTFETTATKSGAVECLGLHFESDEARRAYFSEKLRVKLKDPEFRKIDGFPIGADEDILRLSDPPYYTACPNPFIEDFSRRRSRPTKGSKGPDLQRCDAERIDKEELSADC